MMTIKKVTASSARLLLNETGVLRIPRQKPGHLGNVHLGMTLLDIEILGVSEVRWPGNGMKRNEKLTSYYLST